MIQEYAKTVAKATVFICVRFYVFLVNAICMANQKSLK